MADPASTTGAMTKRASGGPGRDPGAASRRGRHGACGLGGGGGAARRWTGIDEWDRPPVRARWDGAAGGRANGGRWSADPPTGRGAERYGRRCGARRNARLGHRWRPDGGNRRFPVGCHWVDSTGAGLGWIMRGGRWPAADNATSARERGRGSPTGRGGRPPGDRWYPTVASLTRREWGRRSMMGFVSHRRDANTDATGARSGATSGRGWE